MTKQDAPPSVRFGARRKNAHTEESGPRTVRARTDAVVLGGGPGGTAAAITLAQRGRRVVLLERDKFPRYQVGESLVPYSYQVLDKLGVYERVRDAGFTEKHGFQFVFPNGKLARPFYFREAIKDPRFAIWPVTRSRFDALLLERAREAGVVVMEGAEVTDVLFEGDRATGAVYKSKLDGRARRVHAPFVLDATGRSSFIARKLGIRDRDASLDQLAVWRYARGAFRQPGVDGGNVLIALLAPKGWFWWIPLEDGVTSVGVVSSLSHLDEKGKTIEEVFDETLRDNPTIAEWASHGAWMGPHRTAADYTYRAQRFAGPGYWLVGDAAAFIDPVFSSGVYLSLCSGVLAGEATDAALADPSSEAELRADYELLLRRSEDTFRIFVDSFYDERFSVRLLAKEHPEMIPEWGRVLQGDTFEDNRQFCEFLLAYRRELAARAGETHLYRPHVPESFPASAEGSPSRLRAPIEPDRAYARRAARHAEAV